MPRQQKAVHQSAGARPMPVHPSDRELIAGIKQGSEAHFTHLYDRYFQRIYGFVYLRMRNRADAEEVVQETFTAVYRSIDAYRGQSSLAAWIYGIAKNTVNNHIRRARAQAQRVEKAEVGLTFAVENLNACTPEDHLNLRRCESALRESLESVGDWHAEAFVLRHFEDLSIEEIAGRLSRSKDAVRSSLYRMKKILVEAVGSGSATA